jgi:integrase
MANSVRKYQDGKSWYLDKTENGIRDRKSIGAVTEAEAEAQRVTLERRLIGVIPAAGPSFADWVEEYAQWHSEEYPASYARIEGIIRCHLDPYFGTLATGMISPRVVEAYKRARKGEVKPSTITKELRTLQAILNKAVEWDVIPRNPIKGKVKPPKNLNSKPPRFYSRDELAKIFDAPKVGIRKDGVEFPRATYPDHWRLFANTGLRRAELFLIDKNRDIGKDEMRILSHDEGRTKSTKWRTIPLSDAAQDALKRLARHDQIAPPITPYSLSRAFQKDVEAVGLDGSLHCLRHTYCSHLVMAGIPLRTVQVLAGHASIKTTEKYAHLAPDYLKTAVISL